MKVTSDMVEVALFHFNQSHNSVRRGIRDALEAVLADIPEPPTPPKKCKNCGLPIKQHWRIFIHVGTNDARCAYSYAHPEDEP